MEEVAMEERKLVVTVKIDIKSGEIIEVLGPDGKAAEPVDKIVLENKKVTISQIKSYEALYVETNPTCYYWWWDGMRWLKIKYPC
jgi:TusA-related sulfurtransferase